MAPRIREASYAPVIATLPRDRFIEIAVRDVEGNWESVQGAVVGLSHAREAAQDGEVIMVNKRGFDGRFRLLVKRAARRN